MNVWNKAVNLIGLTAKKSYRGKKTNNKWFETQDSISYWDDFNKQKIVWGNLCLSAQFAMAEGGIFINAPSSMIVPGGEFLLAILNSRLADFYIRNLGVTRNGGYFEYKPMFVEQLPVPILDEAMKQPLISLVNQITDAKRAGNDISEIDLHLDNLIFDLYQLSPNEKAFLRQ